MATIAEWVEQLLSLMREVALPTLLALDRELHLLLEQKSGKKLWMGQGTPVQTEFCQRYPYIAVDPDLFALVGIHPEHPVEEDETLISEQISRRLVGVKILVDVNVFIDVMTKRANWEGSLRILNLVRRSREVEGWTSALTVPLLYFFRLRVDDERQARADAQASVRGVSSGPSQRGTYLQSARLGIA
jgi:hypothetical protein